MRFLRLPSRPESRATTTTRRPRRPRQRESPQRRLHLVEGARPRSARQSEQREEKKRGQFPRGFVRRATHPDLRPRPRLKKKLPPRSPTAPFLEHQRGGGDGLGGTVSSSSEGVSSTEAAAAAEEEEAGDDPDWESGNGSRSGGGGVPLLRLSLRAQREFVAVAAAASSSPPLPPPPRNTRQRRASAMATLTDEGIAFATKGGARAGARRSSSSPPPPPPSPPPSRWSRTLLLPPLLPFSEIVGAEALPRSGGASSSSSSPSSLASFLRNCTASSPQREPWLVRVHTVSKGSKLGDWKPRAVSLLAPSPHAARTWASSISASAASSHAGRPRSLLVLLNPYGGAKGAARRVWRRVAQPLLEGVARIRCEVLETDSAGHAERAVRGLGLERLRSLDGIVVVGGDGLFQEALNGLLAIRFGGGGGGCGGGGEEGGADGEVAASAAAAAAADSTPTASSLRSLEASRLRLGHIPAGSTDALAWSVHGTRCPAAAALHVALGDGARLDVLALGPVPRGLLHVEKGGAAAAAPPPPRSSIAEEEKESSSGGGGGGGSRDEAAEADDAAGRSPLTPRGAPTSSGGGSNGAGAGESSSSAAAPVAPPSPPRLGTSSSPPDTEWPPRAAACMASCGYFGDLLALSEKMRWLGPARYGVAGFLTLAFLKRYDLRILYLPAETEGEGADERGSAPETPRTPAAWPLLPGAVGRAFACQQPASGAAATAAAAAASSSPRSSPSITCPATEWKTVEGSFSAVLLACLPCRSDRSASGIAPDRAMADGLASLVRVRACSRLQFLRFLVAVSKDGARVVEEAAAAVSCSGGAGGGAGGGEGEGKGPIGRERGGGGGAAALPWVSVVAVRAVAVEPLSPPSPSSASSPKNYLPWNADGETLPPAGVAAVVRKGLVRVFARPQLDDDE